MKNRYIFLLVLVLTALLILTPANAGFFDNLFKQIKSNTQVISAVQPSSNNANSNYVKHYTKKCYDSYVYWFDNKDVRTDKIETCKYGCSEGVCLSQNKVSGAVTYSQTAKYSSSYPVIFVHGWHGDLSTFREMQDQLNADKIVEDKGDIYSTSTTSICSGWSKAVSVNFEYYDNGQDKGIDYYADKLASAINTLKSCTGSSKVNIVAHSMGGLISRKYMEKYGSSSVNKLIMLETPNFGSPLAGQSSSSDAKLMIPGSSFLLKLNSNSKECIYRNKMVNIASQSITEGLVDSGVKAESLKDTCSGLTMSIVAPVASTRLAKATNIELSGCGHTDLIAASVASPRCTTAYYNVKRYIS
jgi:uncharacterized alpha/beta hydrolase family protein